MIQYLIPYQCLVHFVLHKAIPNVGFGAHSPGLHSLRIPQGGVGHRIWVTKPPWLLLAVSPLLSLHFTPLLYLQTAISCSATFPSCHLTERCIFSSINLAP